MTLFHRIRMALTNAGTITYCESCARVCDMTCRAASVRDQALTTAVLRGGR